MQTPRPINHRKQGDKPLFLAVICVVLAAAARSSFGQSFPYDARPRADVTGATHFSDDPAPRLMEPSEEVGQPLPRRRYLDPRYRELARSRRGIESYRWASREPASRVISRDYDGAGGLAQPSGDPFIEAPPGSSSVLQPAEDARPWTGNRPQVVLPEPVPSGGGYVPDGSFIDGPPASYSDEYHGCGECQQCGECCDPCGRHRCGHSQWGGNSFWDTSLWRNFSTWTGAQGFKGPVDRGVNGNFGFSKGINTAIPIVDSAGIGFQFGGTLALSDFEGSAGLVDHARTQIFVTGGVFRRAECNQGFQGGAVVDYVYDDFYVSMNLTQVRAELGYLWGFHEIGFWGAVHTNSDTANAPATFGVPTVTWQANDQYNLYYRANFSYGAVGRMWVGLTGYGDILFGGDAVAPLSERWSILVAQNYLLPTGNSAVPNSIRETWGLTIAMVWYPQAKTRNACFDPYRPLFAVGDNSWMFVNEK